MYSSEGVTILVFEALALPYVAVESGHAIRVENTTAVVRSSTSNLVGCTNHGRVHESADAIYDVLISTGS